MIFALLPVKAPQNAKQRLSALLTAAQREALARRLFDNMLSTLCSVEGLARVVVVTSDDEIARRAREHGADVFEEQEQRSHSHSADAAALRAMEMGASTVLLLPIDVPLVTKAEIESLIAEIEPGVAIIPSADGTGTNGLVRTPPNVIRSCFGPGSLRAHTEQALNAQVPFRITKPAGLLFDIDTPEDISELLQRAPGNRISEFLRSECLFASQD